MGLPVRNELIINGLLAYSLIISPSKSTKRQKMIKNCHLLTNLCVMCRISCHRLPKPAFLSRIKTSLLDIPGNYMNR